VLGHPLLAWMGTISYGIYLWHYPVLELVGPRLLGNTASHPTGKIALTWLAVIGGGVALGAASWYLVERPFQRLFNSRRSREQRGNRPEHMPDMDTAVQWTFDPSTPST
jgi:peptidoglycan/LPS O-acetylase OafA/YrhL